MTSIHTFQGDLIPDAATRERRMTACLEARGVTLNTKQICDLELLLSGAFQPLRGYLSRADYQSVCTHMRLTDGTLYPIPVMLDLDEHALAGATIGDALALRDKEGNPLALLIIEEIWEPDKREEARAVFGTDDPRHAGVALSLDTGRYYVSGELQGIRLPSHFDFTRFRHTPAQLRALFQEKGWQRVLGFQTRNPLHRVHENLLDETAAALDAGILLHPVVGLTQPGDINMAVRVQSYKHVLARLGVTRGLLSLLPLAMRLAGPREALWHAMIRKQYGCTHFVVGHDHAGPGSVSERRLFYEPYAAYELVCDHAEEIGIEIVLSRRLSYVPRDRVYLPSQEIEDGSDGFPVTSTELRARLRAGAEVPPWMMYGEDVEVLRRAFPPRQSQGLTLFFTGLSGAGKSTVAKALFNALQELGRPITLLDGDVVRLHLSKGLGFSKEDRDTNILRIGYVASLITKCGGIAICAPIAPYRVTRRKVREMVEAYGGFVEVHVATPLSVCEARDPKGLYAKARAGKLQGLTGIDDPYEAPDHPEIMLDTSALSVAESVTAVVNWLRREGYVPECDADNLLAGELPSD